MTQGCVLSDKEVEAISHKLWGGLADRAVAIYVTGSYAGRYAVSGSDIDLEILVEGNSTSEDQARLDEVLDGLNADAPIELDVGVRGTQDTVLPALRFCSSLVMGRDVRDDLIVDSVPDWIWQRSFAACWLTCHLFERKGVARIPMAFPDADGEFYGYTTRRGNSELHTEGTTKDLVRATSWTATAVVADTIGEYVYSKSHLLELLDGNMPKEWALFVRELIEFCRTKTAYAIPAEARQRAKLRELCRRTREFEDYYLTVFRSKLLAMLRGSAEEVSRARASFERTPFHDAEINDALALLPT